jgi:hypothetical protein
VSKAEKAAAKPKARKKATRKQEAGALTVLADPWVFGTAGAVALVESLAMVVPVVATAWEAIHTAIKPLAAAIIAVLATWGELRLAVVAALAWTGRDGSTPCGPSRSPAARCYRGAARPGGLARGGLMRLGDDGDRSNVEDRRGLSRLGGTPMRLGIGGTLLLLVASVVFKQDFFSMLASDQGASEPAAGTGAAPDPQRLQAEQALEKVAVGSFNDAQQVFSEALARGGTTYKTARLVLFWDEVRSACGAAAAEMGPFYCPGDERVYIDLGFYRELASRFGAPGQFAQAYVIAHELGHHVQGVLGIEPKVRAAQRRNPARQNALSVAMELQADCLAGVWGHSARQRGLLDPGDVEAGLNAAAAIGDDRLQRQATGRVSPESFTHGSSEQRVRWFRRGLESGDPAACDTFADRP